MRPTRRGGVVTIDSCVGRFSEAAAAADGAGATFGRGESAARSGSGGIGGASSGDGARSDTARVTPLERWDVESAAPAVSHKPGSRFGRWALFLVFQLCFDPCTSRVNALVAIMLLLCEKINTGMC